MKMIKFKSSVFTTFTSTIESCVYVYRDYLKQNIIKVPDEIVDTCLTVRDEQCDGSEWMLYILTRSGHLYKVTRSHIAEQLSRPDSLEAGNHEIFDDLLKTDDDPFGLKLKSTSEPVFEFSPQQAVYKTENTVHSFAVSCDLVAVVTSTTSHFKVELYSESLLQPSKENISRHSNFLSHSFPRKFFNGKVDEKCLLYFIVSDLINTAEISSSNCINISTSLFKSLFGREPCLLNSPVIMICPPDGAVYYAPIKTLEGSQFQPKTLCNLTCQVVGIQPFNLSDLHKQNTDNMVVIQNVSDDSSNNNSGLVICADNGRCMVVTNTRENVALFVPLVIPGPVQDFSIYCNKLYHSTGTSLHENVLELNDDRDNVINMSKPANLKFVNIQKIVCLPKTNETISQRCDLLCQLYNGEIKVIDPESCKSRRGGHQGELFGTGQQIKDLLQSIDSCNIESEHLNILQEQQSNFMTQMSIASFLLSEYKNGRQCVFKSVFKVNRSDSGLVKNLHLSCQITNQSQVTLSQAWSAMVTIRQNDKQTCDWSKHCIQLQNGLGQNSTVNLCVPLSGEHVFMPFEICTYLILHLPESLELKCHKKDTQQTVLPIQISEERIDILYFLQDECFSVTSGVNLPASSADVLEKLARNKSISNCFEEASSPVSERNDSCTMTLSVSTKLLKNKHIEEYGNDEVAFLKYLLKDSHLLSPQVKRNISVVTIVGHKVLLNVQKCCQGDERLQIDIRSNHTGVCAAVRLALLYRIEKLGDVSIDIPASVNKLKSVSRDYQVHLKEFQQVLENSEYGSCNKETKERLLGLYKQIRQKDTF